MKEVVFRNLSIIRLSIAFLIFLILFIYPLLGWLSIKGYFVNLIGILPLSYEIVDLLKNKGFRKNKTVKLNLFVQIRTWWSICILILLLMVFLFPLYFPPIMKSTADSNAEHITGIVEEITKNTTNDVEKSKIILEWFDGNSENIHNVYGKKLLFFQIYPLHIYLEKPYFCIRLLGHQNPLWVLTSRCGACAEYSLLFREMASAANLTVRSIHNPGEDHNWDEVLINDDWIVVVDPTQVNLGSNSSGYNISRGFFEERRDLNISYVFALYSNGTKEDVSYRYTNLTNLTILTLDENKNPLPNVSMFILSNNYRKEVDTNLNSISNSQGKCKVEIGGGNYTIIAKDHGFIPLFNKTTFSVNENKDNNITIILKKDWAEISFSNTLLNILLSALIPVLLWILITFYICLIKGNYSKRDHLSM